MSAFDGLTQVAKLAPDQLATGRVDDDVAADRYSTQRFSDSVCAPQAQSSLTAAQHHYPPAVRVAHGREIGDQIRELRLVANGIPADHSEPDPRSVGQRCTADCAEV